jgi:hypothetical protein
MLGINVRLSGASSRVGDLAIKNAAGSKYMAGGVLNWALPVPGFLLAPRQSLPAAAWHERPALLKLLRNLR